MSNQEVRVVSKNNYRYWGLASDIIIAIVPILYLIITYDVFKKSKVQTTIWFWIILIIIFSLAKKFLIKFIFDLRENQSLFAKRGTLIIVLALISLILTFSYLWIKDLIVLLLVYAFGLLLSMFPYYKYVKNKEFYDKVMGINETEKIKQDIKDGKIVVK